MGRSDPYIFQEYLSMLELESFKPSTCAFLGARGEDAFTSMIPGLHDFYDLFSPGKPWNINDDWKLDKTYDLIICTRCPYFAKKPVEFIQACQRHLNPGGKILLDWGLGDHWRFSMYKVGWVRNGEHEFAYAPDNFLYSCLWRDEFQHDPEVMKYWNSVKERFGYSHMNISDVIRDEVPVIFDYEFKKIKFKFMWPDAPQLYIIVTI